MEQLQTKEGVINSSPSRRPGAVSVPTPVASTYQFGPFEVNPASGELLKAGKRIKIQDQPFRLLVTLLKHSGQVVTREEIQARIWQANTFVDFDSSLRVAVRKLREALGDDAENPQYIETIPKRGYRFLVSAVRPSLGPVAEAGSALPATRLAPPPKVDERLERPQAGFAHPKQWISIVILLLIGGTIAFLFFPRGSRRLIGGDTVVLADFANSTGEAVFDSALRQGLAVQLEQSPFLTLVSEPHVQQTLRLMGQPPDTRLTPEMAYELCRRTQSAAVIDGSIANLGSQYVLGLKAISCRTGDSLADEQERAPGKERVLAALDKAATNLRKKLGESLNSVEKFDTPLEQATTPSMEALHAYSLGRKTMVVKNEFAAAVPFFHHAILLDPKFAMAYAALGSAYSNLGETTLGAENVRKAYDLRVRVSEPERFYIESTYYHYLTGDLEKARQAYELSSQTYPRYAGTPTRLAVLYWDLGQWDRALAEAREALRLDPARGLSYSNLTGIYLSLNRLGEARATAEEAQAKNLDSPSIRSNLYLIAFLENDTTGMARQVQWASGKPDVEDAFLELEADTAAYFGRLRRARDFSRRAVASARRAEKAERVAGYEANAAMLEVLHGNMPESRLHATFALQHPTGRDAQYGAALALGFAADVTRTRALADDLARRFPDDTIVQFNYLPTLRAQVALSHNDPSKAIEELQISAPYELGSPGTAFSPRLYPVYLRGQAYLAAHQSDAAAVEFQKIIDHRAIVAREPIAALAHLQLGRAYAMSGNILKAKAAYQDFLALWKDADPDLPVLRQAKAEYAKMQ